MINLHTVIIVICLFCGVTSSFAQEAGNATYYSNKLHGRYTASGLRYHKDSLTCAHRTLPFGTRIKVTNTRNQKSVLVTVTDRGPHSKKYNIDLSYAAAKCLDIIQTGSCPVELQIIKPEEPNSKSEKD